MGNYKKPCAILFDVDGLLIEGYSKNPLYRRQWDIDMKADLGIDQDDFREEFIFKDFTTHVLLGKRCLKESLSDVLPKIGFHDDAQIVIDYWLKKDSYINQATRGYVKQIKSASSAPLYLATHQEHFRANHLMSGLGFNQYFDDIFHSARIGYMKTDPRYYSAVEELIANNNDDKHFIFFDDSHDVIAAANDYGWEAHLFETADDIRKSPYINALLNK